MLPVLYSFRRCPYAIRARLTIKYSGQNVQLREVVLKEKPEEMLAISAKGTVPVLELADGKVIDESLDIMLWALGQQDPEGWLTAAPINESLQLIEQNDFTFKPWLDKYKYAVGYPEQPPEYYREQCATFLDQLEKRLDTAENNPQLFGNRVCLADMAILPFVRQCAYVDKPWFDANYTHLKKWLEKHLQSELFLSVMHKYPQWKADSDNVRFLSDCPAISLNKTGTNKKAAG